MINAASWSSSTLELVHEERQCRTTLLRRRADSFQQGAEVVLEIAVVSKAGLGIKIDSDFYVPVLELQCFSEADKAAKRTRGKILGFVVSREPQQCDA